MEEVLAPGESPDPAIDVIEARTLETSIEQPEVAALSPSLGSESPPSLDSHNIPEIRSLIDKELMLSPIQEVSSPIELDVELDHSSPSYLPVEVEPILLKKIKRRSSSVTLSEPPASGISPTACAQVLNNLRLIKAGKNPNYKENSPVSDEFQSSEDEDYKNWYADNSPLYLSDSRTTRSKTGKFAVLTKLQSGRKKGGKKENPVLGMVSVEEYYLLVEDGEYGIVALVSVGGIKGIISVNKWMYLGRFEFEVMECSLVFMTRQGSVRLLTQQLDFRCWRKYLRSAGVSFMAQVLTRKFEFWSSVLCAFEVGTQIVVPCVSNGSETGTLVRLGHGSFLGRHCTVKSWASVCVCNGTVKVAVFGTRRLAFLFLIGPEFRD